MTGTVHVRLQTNRIFYDLAFDRNISVIRGDSGTGKSYLCLLLERAISGEEGITLRCTEGIHCAVMPENTSANGFSKSWKQIIAESHNTLFFIDEFCDCLHSGSFAQAIKHTTNYYVLITRKVHAELPYSVQSIYTLDYERGEFLRVINSCGYGVYEGTLAEVDKCIVEDSGTGADLFFALLGRPVLSAGSKTRVFKKIKDVYKEAKSLLVIVDGAAFGSEVCRVLALLHQSQIPYKIIYPECTEWLLLHSNIFSEDKRLADLLIDYLRYIDYSKYFSVERYFVALLTEACDNFNLFPYGKSHGSLDPVFLSPSNLSALREVLDAKFLREIDSQNSGATHLFD